MAKQSKNPANNPASRLESIFAYMAVGLIGTSILAMVAALLIAATGSNTPALGEQVLPPVLVFYPAIWIGCRCRFNHRPADH